MYRSAILLLGFIAAMTFISATPSLAQRTIGDQPLSAGAKRLKGKGAGDYGSSVGFTVAPGVIVTPSGFIEAGHDSNPNRSFDEIESNFLQTGAGLSITKIGRDGAANIAAQGSWLGLDEDQIRGDRLFGRVSADGVYTLMPGLLVKAGGFIEHDAIDFTEDEAWGVFSELTYANDTITTFLLGRVIDVRYLTQSAIPTTVPAGLAPLFRIENFDARRAELSVGGLYGNNNWLAPYFEAAAANVNYTDQRLPSVVNRDADDFYAKGGLRVTVSPSLQADIGWRWNHRNVDDPAVDNFSSDFFDGSIRWNPWPFFSAYATVDRKIEEPSLAFSRLSDVKGFEGGFTYFPTERISITAKARREIINEIGDPSLFRRRLWFSETTYALSQYTQLYYQVIFDTLEEDRSDLDYERFRIGVGARVSLGEDASGRIADPLGDRSALFAAPREINLPSGAQLRMSAGYSYLDLPSTNMTTLIGGVFFDQALGQIQDHSGNFDGVRFDVELRDFARHYFSRGRSLTFGVGGFYAFFDEEETSACTFTATIDCAFVNIDDFDPNGENNTGPFGVLFTTTDREVHYWGISLDAKFGHLHGGGMKDDPVHRVSPFKAGIAVRAINQEVDLFAIDRSVPDPVDYKENVNTYYYGGYIGVDHRIPLPNGFQFEIDAEAGVYYAHTDFEGRYIAYIPVGGTQYIVEQGGVDGASDDAAFIGSVRMDLTRAFNWGRLGVYGIAEYLSYVPEVRYNNNDEAGGSPFGVIGTQVGTVLDDDDAFSYTVGLTATVPFN